MIAQKQYLSSKKGSEAVQLMQWKLETTTMIIIGLLANNAIRRDQMFYFYDDENVMAFGGRIVITGWLKKIYQPMYP